MDLTHRRAVLAALATSPLWLPRSVTAASVPFKIAHQFPGGTADDGDFRDRLVRMFAAEVQQRSGGALAFTVHPNGTLIKPDLQFVALQKDKLDMALVGLSVAGRTVPEMNIGMMPGLVTSYAQAYGWKRQPVGRELTRMLAERGVVILSWIWQSGGAASRGKPLVRPEDARGLKVRGGSHEMNLVLQMAGAQVLDLPSSQMFDAMKSGRIDAAITSSTSLLTYQMSDVAKAVTVGRGQSYWFNLAPLMMSKAAFDRLSRAHQDMLMEVGEKMEGFARMTAGLDDTVLADAFRRAGLQVSTLAPDVIGAWQDLARKTAWSDFAGRTKQCARLLALAEQTL
jgi:TRAP-type C4-dicarboxylate transport system substrate-binding protein